MNPAGRQDRSYRYVYRGSLPPWLALLVLAPLGALLLASLAVAAGLAAVLALPLLWRRVGRRTEAEPDCIELDRDDYHTVQSGELPPPRA